MVQQKRSEGKTRSVMETNWKEYYTAHQMSAEEAVNLISSGDRVVIMHASGEPSYLVDAMVANAQAYEDVEIVHMVPMGTAEYAKPGMEKHFRHNAPFTGGSTKAAIAEGRADFTPCFFYEVPRLLETTLPVDVALVTITPPDKNGRCSLGISVDYTMAAIKTAKKVIAQVNGEMPFTHGDSIVDVSEIDAFVLHDAPMITLPNPKIGPVEEAIGKNCAKLIRDGDTLQLGIGSIPDAVLQYVTD